MPSAPPLPPRVDQVITIHDHLVLESDRLVLESDRLVLEFDRLVLEFDRLVIDSDRLAIGRDPLTVCSGWAWRRGEPHGDDGHGCVWQDGSGNRWTWGYTGIEKRLAPCGRQMLGRKESSCPR